MSCGRHLIVLGPQQFRSLLKIPVFGKPVCFLLRLTRTPSSAAAIQREKGQKFSHFHAVGLYGLAGDSKVAPPYRSRLARPERGADAVSAGCKAPPYLPLQLDRISRPLAVDLVAGLLDFSAFLAGVLLFLRSNATGRPPHRKNSPQTSQRPLPTGREATCSRMLRQRVQFRDSAKTDTPPYVELTRPT